MFLIIISLILTILVCVGLCWDNEEDEFKYNKRCWLGLLCLLLILFGCFKSIKTGEVGIKTRFGKITDTYLKEGINFKLPIEKIEKVNIKVQKYENEEPLSSSTKDMQIVNNIKVTVNYQVDSKKVVDLYRSVGTNYEETILEPSIQETIKAVISKYNSEELVTKRSEVSLDINNTLDNKMKQFGIHSVSVAINNFDFSASYNQAIEQKAVAEQQVATAQKQQEKAKIDAETKKIKAQGDADANKVLEKSLTREILQEQFIAKWDGKLPIVTSNSSNIIDVSKYIK